MIDTTEAGGGSYPSPSESGNKKISGTIVVSYKFADEFAKSYSRETIEEYIKQNYFDYLQEFEEVVDLEVYEENEEE